MLTLLYGINPNKHPYSDKHPPASFPKKTVDSRYLEIKGTL